MSLRNLSEPRFLWFWCGIITQLSKMVTLQVWAKMLNSVGEQVVPSIKEEEWEFTTSCTVEEMAGLLES